MVYELAIGFMVAAGMSISFDNSYARLPERFFAPIKLGTNSNPRLVKVNAALAHELGLDADVLKNAKYFTGAETPVGATPIAMAYAGHQFGHFVPQLGDGRALLLGEVIGQDGARYDIHLKGSGPTPFSRRGDGRAALGPVLREYIVAEAMHALGIPTTRALAIATTGDPVYRETAQPGAVLTRVARSHIRVGTFQYFAARQDVEGLRILTDYAIARYYPDALTAPRGVIHGQSLRQKFPIGIFFPTAQGEKLCEQRWRIVREAVDADNLVAWIFDHTPFLLL